MPGTRRACQRRGHGGGAFAFPSAAEPSLLAIAAGITAQAAQVSMRAAVRGLHAGGLRIARPAAVTAMAGILTALAVHAAG